MPAPARASGPPILDSECGPARAWPPWFVLCLMAQPAARMVYNLAGAVLMMAGATVSLAAYRLMLRTQLSARTRRAPDEPSCVCPVAGGRPGPDSSSVLKRFSADRVASCCAVRLCVSLCWKEQERREPELLEAISAFPRAGLLRSPSSSRLAA